MSDYTDNDGVEPLLLGLRSLARQKVAAMPQIRMSDEELTAWIVRALGAWNQTIDDAIIEAMMEAGWECWAARENGDEYWPPKPGALPRLPSTRIARLAPPPAPAPVPTRKARRKEIRNA